MIQATEEIVIYDHNLFIVQAIVAALNHKSKQSGVTKLSLIQLKSVNFPCQPEHLLTIWLSPRDSDLCNLPADTMLSLDVSCHQWP